LAGSPKFTTDKLQHVMNSAARVVSNTWKFDSSLSRLLHDELRWLDVADRVFKLALLVYRCRHELLRCTWWKVARKQPTSSVVNTSGPPVRGID